MKRITHAFTFASLLICVLGAPNTTRAQTAPCPDPPNRLTVQVYVDVKYDAARGLYTYAYTVSNDATSAQEVEWFSLDFVPPISNILSPRGWMDGNFHGRSTMGWDAFELAEPDRIPDDASVPPSIVQIKPGATLSGFSFQSPKPPGPVKYYVTGWVPLTVSTGATIAEAELMAEQRMEDCPSGHILDQSVIGATLGPSDALTVGIDIKPGSKRNAINPRSEGVVPVAILGSATLEVNRVDPASVRLGPGQAAPKKAKGHPEDVNRNGYLDLVFHFPIADIGQRSGDTSLFLTGRLRDGTAIVGVDSVVVVDCKRKHRPGHDDDERDDRHREECK